MASPVTTTEVLLQEIAESLVEIRDLLRDHNTGASGGASQSAPAKQGTAGGRRGKGAAARAKS